MTLTVNENIKRIRKERGLTQKRLGEICGIAEPNIRKYENGKQNPKLETVEKIASALGVSAFELMGSTSIIHGRFAFFIFMEKATAEQKISRHPL